MIYEDFKIIENKLNKENFRFYESIMSIANEYMGMRGNFEETYTGNSHKGLYLGGVWFPDKTRVGWWKNGYPKYFGKMINSPNYIGINIFIDDEELDLFKEKILAYKRTLDMKNGILERQFTIDRAGKKFSFTVKRFVSIVQKEICAIQYKIKSLNAEAKIKIVPYLDADVKNEDANYEEQFWTILDKNISENEGYILSKTIENNFGVEQFSVCNYMINNSNLNLKENFVADKKVFITYEKNISADEELYLEKIVATTNTRNIEEEKLIEEAKKLSQEAAKKTFENLYKEHALKWNERWKLSDVIIKNNLELQQGIRYNLFQLFSTYYGEDYRLNIGPKGFTGEKYGGATYWDTEAFILPMYLSVAPQEVSKNLLLYRYKQLEQAKHNARQQGLDGALYPMVTFNGIECHNEWEITFEELHRNGAMAYAIYNYVNYSGDYSYLDDFGLEVLIEISKFWAARVHYSKRKDKYMLHGITGPNEYENNVNNNWFTNTFAAWTLRYTLEVLNKNREENKKRFMLDEKTLAKWQDIINKMYYAYDEELNIFVQNDGFLDKELIKVADLDRKNLPLNQNWSWDKILRSCFIKQADVVQGLYVFGDKFTKKEKKSNFNFYEAMTVHESSLSASIHSIIASEIGELDKAVELYRRTAKLDLDNYNNDTEDGLHITSMSGSWLAIVHGFAGMKTFNESLSFYPQLPKDWDGYSFNINYRNSLLNIDVDKKEVKITLKAGSSLKIKIYDEEYLLEKEIKVALKEV